MFLFLSNHHLPHISTLLLGCGLMDEDIHSAQWLKLLGYQADQRLVAVGGIEITGSKLLLRSVAVHPDFRNQNLATEIINRLHKMAKAKGFDRCYLLTNTAEAYFQKRFNYEKMERNTVSQAIKNSTQFSRLCPDSAVVMTKPL